MFICDEDLWALRTFGHAELGDARRTSRLVRMSAAIARHPRFSVDAACGGNVAEAEGAHRLVRNPSFGAGAIFDAGATSTAGAAAQEPGDLLALEDSTTLSFPHSVAEDLGDVGGERSSKKGGWWVHSTLLFAVQQQLPLGPITQQRWCRPMGGRGRAKQRRERAYEEKESFKWEQASRDMERRLGAETMRRVISVCDREADVFEYLAYKKENGQRFVVRSSWDRKINWEDTAERRYLWEIMEGTEIGGRCKFVIPQKGGRRKRTAELSYRFRQVTLALPKRRRTTAKEPLTMWVLYVKEDAPPEGTEGLEWMLLTSEPMDGVEQAMQVLGHYRARWKIEDWHKAWKSGCGVEDRRQQERANLEKVAVITAFVAIRMLQLRALANVDEEVPCEQVLQEMEWKCLWLSVQ